MAGGKVACKVCLFMNSVFNDSSAKPEEARMILTEVERLC